uniref:Uncharacterized protein n=1 Tax=Anguilla anguilla TaxID=7936 RepID=A0A0E9W1L1_ANGAN
MATSVGESGTEDDMCSL